MQDEKGPPDDDGRMLTAKSKRLRTEAAVVHTGGVLEDAAGRITGIGREIREFFRRRVEKVVRDAVPAATATAPDWSEFIVNYATYIKGKLPSPAMLVIDRALTNGSRVGRW